MFVILCLFFFFFFKQKTAYEMRISDWSSDVCSSDPVADRAVLHLLAVQAAGQGQAVGIADLVGRHQPGTEGAARIEILARRRLRRVPLEIANRIVGEARIAGDMAERVRSEEHTSELQSLMRISYAVFCLKKKKK